MENKLDKLFRNKLEHHAIQPSAQAWEKVAAGFSKKNNTWAWRMAAVVALISVGGFVIGTMTGDKANAITESNPTETTHPSDTSQQAQQKTIANDELIKPIEHLVAQQKEIESKKPGVHKGSPIQATSQKSAKHERPIVPIEEQPIPVTEATEAIAAATTLPETTQSEIIQPTSRTIKTRVITYSLAAVESLPTEEPVKAKPLQRIITLAKEVKGGETTLASVRQWKDNLLGTEEVTRSDSKQ
jgi:hypothetical protein